MVGVKLWIARRCGDEQIDPIIRRATELKAVVLQHTWWKATGNQPGESTPDDLAALAKRHPDATLICGHTGGDWERGMRAIRPFHNVYADLAGGDPTAGSRKWPCASSAPTRALRQRRRRPQLRARNWRRSSGARHPRRRQAAHPRRKPQAPAQADPRRQGGEAVNTPATSYRRIDVNVHVSRWPFRRLPLDETPALLKKLRELA